MLAVRKNFSLFIFLYSSLSFTIASAKIEIVLGSLPPENNPNLVIGMPETLESEIILSRQQFILSYNKLKRVPNWVAWRIDAENIGSSGRTNNFRIDAELETYLAKNSSDFHAVEQTEYKGSCFDRGHQVPSADRTDSPVNNSATFVMSNMTPQTPFLNRMAWAHLEQYTRDLVQKEMKRAYVITGPIFDQDFGAIGPKKDIRVPSKEFKIIFFLAPNQTLEDMDAETEVLTVIMPNTLQDGSSPLKNTAALCRSISLESSDRFDWLKYKTTVNEVEKLSGLTFRLKKTAMANDGGGP